MPHSRPLRVFLLTLIASAASTSAQPTMRASEAAPSSLDRPEASSLRMYRIDAPSLASARAQTLELDLLGEHAVMRIDRRIDRDGGTTSLFGALADEPASRAVVTVVNDAVSARIESPDHGVFIIEPSDQRSPEGEPLHTVFQVDPNARFGDCIEPEFVAHHQAHDAFTPRGLIEVDMLVAWTPQVQTVFGGIDGAAAFAQNAVDITNQAYEDSGINNLRINLVHLMPLDVEATTSNNTNLNRFRLNGDGFWDEVHTVRNEVGADNLVLLFNNSNDGVCGQAAGIDPDTASRAFSVVVRSCAISNLTFPHEVGHTMGCSHDRFNTGFGFYPYSFGYVYAGNTATRRTIMGAGSSGGFRFGGFSNPDINFDGQPTGIAVGQPGAANNAEAHRQSADDMASHRTSQGCSPFVAELDEPETLAACVGQNVSLDLNATEFVPGSVTYLWTKNLVAVPGGTGPSLDLTGVTPADAGLYRCFVSNECTGFSTAFVSLDVIDPGFSTQPQSQTADIGDDVSITAVFSEPGVTQVWFKDNVIALEFLNLETIDLIDVQPEDAGEYVCSALGTCGNVLSSTATLTIGSGPCSPADLDEPLGELDFNDVVAFLTAFAAQSPEADLAAPTGVFDFNDVIGYLSLFSAGCP